MNPHDFERVRDLFDAARRLPAALQERFVRDACANAPALADRIVAMLDVDGMGEVDLDRPLVGVVAMPAFLPGFMPALMPATVAAHHGRRLPARIGGYAIHGVLGEGGMGVVYLAEQVDTRRTVAVKMIRPGLLTPTLARRFEREAEVLARLRHPGIAAIIEAGRHDAATAGPECDVPDGAPYLAMEYVHGRQLVEFAQSTAIDVERRLRLLAQVCRAVHHAHEHGVVHRDIKPTNILIDERHADQPKVVDFGIALVAGAELDLTLRRTHAGQLLGTLAYMSPEQLAGGDVDARSDIYSLGVVGHELLSGRMPFDLTGKGVAECARILAEAEPTPLGAVHRDLRGDLETIILKAIDREPDRRYATAAELADDIDRFLHDVPIRARPATTLSIVRRYARRHRGAVAGACAAALCLIAGVVALGVLLLAVRAERDDARRERRLAEASTYAANIAVAESALADHDVNEARRRLHSCSDEWRGWEWRHLVARLDGSAGNIGGDNGHARACAWHPAGDAIASATRDGVIRLWRSDGSEMAVWLGHRGPVVDLCFSPCGRMLASAGEDGSVRLWTVEGRAALGVLHQGSAWMKSVAWSDDGMWLAAAADTGEVWTWRMDDAGAPAGGRLPSEVPLRDRTVVHTKHERAPLSIDSDSRALLVGIGGSVEAWDVATRERVAGRDFGGPAVQTLASMPGRKAVLVGLSSGHVLCWEWEFDTITPIVQRDFVRTVACGRDGRTALVASDFDVALVSLDLPEVDAVFHGHIARINDLALSATADEFVTASDDGTVRRWRLDQRDVPVWRGHRAWIWSVALTPDGTTLATGAGEFPIEDGTIRLWRTSDGEPAATLDGHKDSAIVFALDFAPDGASLASAGDSQVIVWDVARRAPIARRSLDAPPCALDHSPDGKRVFVGTLGGGCAWLDAATLASLQEWPSIGTVHRVLVVDEDSAFVGLPDGTLKLMRLGEADAAWSCRPHDSGISALALDDRRALMAVASHDESVTIWDLAERSVVDRLRGHAGAVNGLAFSADGSRLFGGGADGKVHVWELSRGTEVAALGGHTGEIRALVRSPDGHRVYSASTDQTVRCWSDEVEREARK